MLNNYKCNLLKELYPNHMVWIYQHGVKLNKMGGISLESFFIISAPKEMIEALNTG